MPSWRRMEYHEYVTTTRYGAGYGQRTDHSTAVSTAGRNMPMSDRIHVVVIGGTSGIGRNVAESFAGRG